MSTHGRKDMPCSTHVVDFMNKYEGNENPLQEPWGAQVLLPLRAPGHREASTHMGNRPWCGWADAV